MTVVFAVLSSLFYGCADFTGGLAARRSPILSVVIWSQFMGAVTVLAVQPLLGPFHLSLDSWIWGMAAGMAGSAGIGFLYHGLSTGLAAIVSPVSAVIGTILPVLFGVFVGERPDLLDWMGVGLAVPATVLLAMERDYSGHSVKDSLCSGFISGLGFGGFFILISRSGDDSGLLPLLAARTAGVPALLLLALVRRQPLILASGTRIATLGAGILDMGANILFLLATRSGLLIVASTLVALYPAPTVLLQKIVFHEKMGVLRLAGFIMAITGIVCIAAR